MLNRVRIILVNPTHAGNIGATARAMKTMGLERLYLVNPKGFPSAEATARAAGADDVLADACVCATLDEALKDATLVLGTSARTRAVAWPEVELRDAARLAGEQQGETAVLFGRERHGLTNEELQRCHYVVSIPANPEFRSLNVASAVQLVAYELRMAVEFREAAQPADKTADLAASAADMEGFYAHLEETLLQTGFLMPERPYRTMMKRLRRLFNRARPDITEINILRGILSTVQKPKRRRPGS